MPTVSALPSSPSRAPAVAATVVVHLLLLGLWFGAQTPRPRPQARGPAMQWLIVPTLTAPPPPPARRTRETAAPGHAGGPPARVAPPPVTIITAAPATPPAPSLSAEPAPPHTTVLDQARRDIGKIASELGKQDARRLHAPADSAQIRLANGIESATRAPRLWEAPKVEVVQDQGGYDRRIYKVKGALGTYCITVESNHAVDGLDQMKNGIQQKVTTCPREQ